MTAFLCCAVYAPALLLLFVTFALCTSYGAASLRLRLKTGRFAPFGFSPSLQSIRTYVPALSLKDKACSLRLHAFM